MKIKTRPFWVVLLVFIAAPLWAKPAPEASDEIFTNTAIRHLRIEIPSTGLRTLRRYSWHGAGSEKDRVSVPATMREDAMVYTNVAVHLKGAAGSFRPVDDKPGFTLKFNKLSEGQYFHGLAKISLNNSVQDPTYITDKLCRELYLRAGLPAPRADYATVELNGRQLGLYVLTEGWDKAFLKRHFKNAHGNFYDPSGAVDINKIKRADFGQNPEDASKLLQTTIAATNSDLTRRVSGIRQCVDLDRFLALCALDTMTWNWDGYSMNKNNFRVFEDLEQQRLVFLPHGMDQMFWKPDGPILTGRNGLVARGLLQTAEGRQLFLKRFDQLYPSVFNAQFLTNRVRELAARIRPVLIKEGSGSGPQFDRAASSLSRRIILRCRNIDAQLASLKKAAPIALNETLQLTNWQWRVEENAASSKNSAPELLHVDAAKGESGTWVTVVWLEEGKYTLKGRVKTSGIAANRNQPDQGAGLKVVSTRKQSAGVHWDWFPFHESNDFAHRGEVTPDGFTPKWLTSTTDWTEVTYEIELRQPLADLEIRCVLYGKTGEAWFDPQSLQLTRHSDLCP